MVGTFFTLLNKAAYIRMMKCFGHDRKAWEKYSTFSSIILEYFSRVIKYMLVLSMFPYLCPLFNFVSYLLFMVLQIFCILNFMKYH